MPGSGRSWTGERQQGALDPQLPRATQSFRTPVFLYFRAQVFQTPDFSLDATLSLRGKKVKSTGLYFSVIMELNHDVANTIAKVKVFT